MDGTISAVKGQAVTIELVADAKTRASVVEFLIRDFPLNGQLGAMISKEADRTRATITYTAFPDTAATTDSFTYAVRYPGGQWSRKGKVDIKLEASEPKIHATTEVDFGKVMIGQSEVREVFISNSGNASYRNQIQLTPPWSLVEPENGLLNLPIGGQRVLKVRFTPEIEGPATHHLTFFRNQGATTQMKAAGYVPFAVETPEVALRWEEKSRTRIGSIAIRGVAPKVVAASVHADERLRLGAGGALFLKPDEPSSLQVYLPAEDVQPYEGTLEVSVGSFKVPVTVSAGIAPAYLVVENIAGGERLIDLGQIKPGGVAQSSFQLRNAGGAPAKVTFSTNAPFSILAAGGRATLTPLEAEAFPVRVTAPPNTIGAYEGAVRIEADTGQSIQIGLRAFFLPAETIPNAMGAPGSIAPVFSPSGTPPPGPTGAVPPSDRPPDPGQPARAPTPQETQRAIDEMDKLRSPLGFVTLPTVERKINASVPAVSGESLFLVEDGRNHLSIGWTPPSVDADTYELEMRVMRMSGENGPLESVWVPYHDVTFEKRAPGQFNADIRGLGPNRNYEFRLFTIGQGGAVSTPLPFVAKTRMPMDWTWIYVGLGALVLGGLGWLAWRVYLARTGGKPVIGYPRSAMPADPFS
jgi:hypothetical protein